MYFSLLFTTNTVVFTVQLKSTTIIRHDQYLKLSGKSFYLSFQIIFKSKI